jgi:hypothetical protein
MKISLFSLLILVSLRTMTDEKLEGSKLNRKAAKNLAGKGKAHSRLTLLPPGPKSATAPVA